MKLRGLFTLNLKTFVSDMVIFVIGYFLAFEFYARYVPTGRGPYLPPAGFYVGLILILVSIVHFIINLIIFIYKRFRKGKRKRK